MTKNTILVSLIIGGFLIGGLSGYLITDLTGEDYDTLLLDFQKMNEDYNSLLLDYNSLQENYTELETKYDILVESEATLTETYNELLNDYNRINLLYQGILIDYNSLIVTYSDLVSENDELQNNFDNLVVAYDTLEESCNLLTNNYNTLLLEYDELIDDYIALEVEIDALTNTYNQLLIDYSALTESLVTLQNNLDNLQIDYDALLITYNQLDVLYSQLEFDYLILEAEYNLLSQQWNQLSTWIKQMTLPAQYLVFAEAVRRYYFQDYYIQDTWATGNVSGYWAEFTRFCRDIVLHDSQTPASLLYGSWFPEVSNALADCLKYGSQTEFLAFAIFWSVYYNWLPNWAGWDLSGNDLTDIYTIVQWCIDEIDYEYDTSITAEQEEFDLDYVKFPVETAFRTMGDCEDQAILCSAYLESCGFETAIAIFHDADNPEFSGGFYHGTTLIKIDDTDTFFNRYPLCPLLTFDEGITQWCWIDTTWDVPFGSIPGWMPYYLINGIESDDMTLGICDIGGLITL